MADNQVEIEVIAKTDTSEVEDLEDLVEEIKSTAEDEVSLNVDASDATSSLEEAESQAGELESELENLDGQTVNLNVDSSQLDDANEKIQETEDSLANVKTALVGLVATAEIEHMATVADNINTSWNRLTLTFDGTGVSMDALKDKVSEVNAETSRGAGVIREYFNQMGIAGVTNVNLLAESFESLSGKAYQTGNSIESMESKMQTMVLTGNASEKMLKSLGLSAEDLANAIGVSVDELSDAFDQLSPEQRLQAITNAMGDGAQANEMYGDSYEAMKAKAEAAMSGLEGAVGQAILPNVIPVLDTATQAVKGLTDGFKNLPEPVQGAIGTVMGVSAIATTGIGMFGDFAESIANLGDAYGVLKKVYEALIPTEIAEGTAGWFSIGWIAAAILLGIALGLAFIYLYENCDWFREAVDTLAATLQWLGEVIYSSVLSAIEWLSQSFQDFTSQIGLNTNDWTQAVLGFILFIQTLPLRIAQILIDTLAQALGFGENFSMTMINSATRAVTGFIQWIINLVTRVQNYFSNLISRVTSFASNFATTIINGAQNAVNGFINWISQLPGKLKGELDHMLSMAADFVKQIANMLTGGAAGMVIGWITGSGESSPGYMYDAFSGELQAMKEAPKKFLGGLGSDMKRIGSGLDSNFMSDVEFANGSITASSRGGEVAGQVNNFYFSDIVVDNDERMERIYDYIVKQMRWDNTTAGRAKDL